MLAEGLDEVVRTGELPRGEEVLARLLDVLQAHVVHDGDEAQVDGRNGVVRGAHEQRRLHDAGADGVLALEVEQVRLHVEREGAQAARQKRQEKPSLLLFEFRV